MSLENHQYLVRVETKSVSFYQYKSINSELLEDSILVKYFDVYMNNAKLYVGIIHLFKMELIITLLIMRVFLSVKFMVTMMMTQGLVSFVFLIWRWSHI